MSKSTQSGKLIVEGRTTAYEGCGKGPTSIVLLSGLGDKFDTWDPIIDQLTDRSYVFRYDRPGYGKSTAVHHGPEGRDGTFVASHLKACLDAADIKPPYVLVGHSMGGLYALCFAKMYQSLLSGLVLIDMRAPTFSAECAQRTDISSEPSWFLKLLFPHHMKSEIRGARAAEGQAAEPEELKDLPVTVIAAAAHGKEASGALSEVWQKTQRDFMDGLDHGRFVIAEQSGHYVHHDEPALVVEEVLRYCN